MQEKGLHSDVNWTNQKCCNPLALNNSTKDIHPIAWTAGAVAVLPSSPQRTGIRPRTSKISFIHLSRNWLFQNFGKRVVGSSIRICKTILKPKYVATFYRLVEECFTPDEEQDPKDTSRLHYGLCISCICVVYYIVYIILCICVILYVEPLTGGIQCNWCKGEWSLCSSFPGY